MDLQIFISLAVVQRMYLLHIYDGVRKLTTPVLPTHSHKENGFSRKEKLLSSKFLCMCIGRLTLLYQPSFFSLRRRRRQKMKLGCGQLSSCFVQPTDRLLWVFACLSMSDSRIHLLSIKNHLNETPDIILSKPPVYEVQHTRGWPGRGAQLVPNSRAANIVILVNYEDDTSIWKK